MVGRFPVHRELGAGAMMFLVLAGLINLISYFYSSKIVLWSYRVSWSASRGPRLTASSATSLP
jgi:hypothetical protein